jgi:hypothetical protein
MSHNGQSLEVDDAGVQDIRWYDDSRLLGNGLPVVQTPINLSLDNYSLSGLRTPTATIRRVPDRIDPTYSQSSTLVKRSGVFEEGPSVRGEWITAIPQANEEPTIIATLPCHIRPLAFLALYHELSSARSLEDFASVRNRSQQEWIFNGGFLIGLAAVNVAMFAITPDSNFKVKPYTYTAVAISSAACGLGIACDVWLLVRYSWVDLGTFIHRSRDVYGSHVFFSLSPRMPTLCVMTASISLLGFMGLVAYDAGSIGVLIVGVVVFLVMTLQFTMYGTHRCAVFALHICKAGTVLMVNVVRRLRGLASRG